ncbi:hypothetical protein IC800_18775 (plasmid) [Acinetobacter seifertii]|uniref:hypothetical protein n=1 Tax=Acinetobacter seifertii TaxID=1530123 RepID=UPI00168CBDFC|nr:hypothetical protein [Acinetobacter seifertii]QNW96589.1 hypothetical protein IC800_18775 [Acinetobacter seifertii]
MKAPKGISTVTSSNAHIANEKTHIVNSLNYDKLQKIPINPDLYKKIDKVASKRKIVLADIVREALEFYLNNPNAPYCAELIQKNSKKLIYNINHLIDVKVEKFKTDHGVNRSNQIRRALSAWLIKENF